MNKYQTFVPAKFDQSELDRRIQNKKAFYEQYHLLEAISLPNLLDELERLHKEGYSRDSEFTPLLYPNQSGALFLVRFIKPKALQTKELKQIELAETEAYQAWLEEQREIAIQNMTQRLIAEEKEKEASEQEKAKALALEKARVEAIQILELGDD